jgi:shikimate dehydrogenase
MHDHRRVGLFIALDFEDEREFTDCLPSLIEGGFRGLSVTHPFKEAAFEVADRAGPGAVACGVANTLSFDPEGIVAENTDLVAILRRLDELRSSGRWDGSSLGVIGAGGAARATLAAARSLGVEAFVWARRPGTAERLAQEFGARAVEDPKRTRPALVVHATTIGRAEAGPPTPPDLGWIRPGVHTVDWVYAVEDPVVRMAAVRAGTTYEDGSRLLVYQAAASYGLWWGEEPTPEEVSAAFEEIR